MKTTDQNIAPNINFDKIDKHPNILIAASLWDMDRFNAAKICYKFMRTIDDMIDDRKASQETLGCMEKQMLSERVHNWISCLDRNINEDPFINEVSGTITKFKIPLKLFHNFARAMQFDIDHQGFATYDEFIHYAEGASVAPASVFVHLCCLGEKDGEYLSPAFDIVELARPCAIFSYLVHIIRDFEKDQKENLNYFAHDLLAKYGLSPQKLRDIAYGAPVPTEFRLLIREYVEYAKYWAGQTLLAIQNLESSVKGRYMASLVVIYSLYDMVFKRIDVENGNFSTAELNPSMAARLVALEITVTPDTLVT